MDAKKISLAVTINGVEFTRVPVVGTLIFMTNPTKDKFVNPPELSQPELDLLCPDGTAFAFLIRGEALEPAVCDGWYAVFSQDRPPEKGDLVLTQLKTGLNYFGRLCKTDEAKSVIRLPEIVRTPGNKEIELSTEEISLMTRMILVSKERKKFG